MPQHIKKGSSVFSFTHIAIVFIIALLVFGPEKLPEVARVIGKALGDFRRVSTDFRRVIETEFSEIERQTREKEELARQKALEATAAASNAGSEAASVTAPAGAQDAPPEATNSIAPPSTSAPEGSVVHSAARTITSNPAAETIATPGDGHPA